MEPRITPHSERYPQRRDVLPEASLGELLNLYQSNFNTCSTILSFATRAGTDFKRIESEARESLKATRAVAAKAKSDLAKSQEEAKQVVEAVRATAAETGVSQNAVYYQLAGENHEKLSRKWLNWTGGIGAGTALYIIAGVASLLKVYGVEKRLELNYLSLGFVLIFVLLAYGLHFVIRQYNSHRHNCIVNFDKAKALSTFLTFAEATENVDVKNVVLQQAAVAVFTPAPSGYLKDPPKLVPPIIQIAERAISRGFGPQAHSGTA